MDKKENEEYINKGESEDKMIKEIHIFKLHIKIKEQGEENKSTDTFFKPER